jgi:hypothetical protein
MSTDVEAAKQKYLSQWQHCTSKSITAVDSSLKCDCGAKFPWTAALGETVDGALAANWLVPVFNSESEQPSLF